MYRTESEAEQFWELWFTRPTPWKKEREVNDAIPKVMEKLMSSPMPITVMYRNHRGETRRRIIQPETLWYGTTEWHPTEQWFIKGICLETGEGRDFALADFLGEVP